MSQTQHTPGPWHVSDGLEDSGRIGVVVRHESGGRIADVYHGCHNAINRDAESNAHLIAAAPELLKALKRAVKDELGDNWKPLAEIAIAKAEGKSQKVKAA